MKTVLITGGTGLVGTRLTEMLLAKGYAVAHLSRSAGKNPHVKSYRWDIEKGEKLRVLEPNGKFSMSVAYSPGIYFSFIHFYLSFF